jgi:hypothetical protein
LTSWPRPMVRLMVSDMFSPARTRMREWLNRELDVGVGDVRQQFPPQCFRFYTVKSRFNVNEDNEKRPSLRSRAVWTMVTNSFHMSDTILGVKTPLRSSKS